MFLINRNIILRCILQQIIQSTFNAFISKYPWKMLQPRRKRIILFNKHRRHYAHCPQSHQQIILEIMFGAVSIQKRNVGCPISKLGPVNGHYKDLKYFWSIVYLKSSYNCKVFNMWQNFFLITILRKHIEFYRLKIPKAIKLWRICVSSLSTIPHLELSDLKWFCCWWI